VLTLQAKPRLLHHIVGIGQTAQRAVGESAQIRALFLEPPSQFGGIELFGGSVVGHCNHRFGRVEVRTGGRVSNADTEVTTRVSRV